MSNTALYSSTPTRRGIRSAIAGAGVLALTIGGAGGLAAFAAPDDDSEAQGRFLQGQVGPLNLDDVAELVYAYAETPSGSPEENVGLTAEVLNALVIPLGSINLLGDNGLITLGAVEQRAEAEANGDATAGSGAITDEGAIAIDETPDPDFANASVRLDSLLDDAGIDEIIETLSLEIGALAATAEQEGGAPATSDYMIADLTIDTESGLVGGLYESLLSEVGVLQGVLDGLEESIDGAIAIDLGNLAGTNADVTLGIPTLADLLPSGDIVNTNGVTINLEQGTVSVDLEQVLGGDGSLNGLDPNTELLSGAVLGSITTAVVDALTDILDDFVTEVTDAVNGITLDGTVTVSVVGGSLVADLGGTLLAPEATIDTTGILPVTLAAILALLGTDLDGVANAILDAVTGLLGDATDGVTDLDLAVDGLVDGLVDEVVSPLLDAVNDLVSLTANVQPTEAGGEGDLGPDSFTVRALSIGLLPDSTVLGTEIGLASATVRGTEAAADPTDPTDPGDPTEPTDPGNEPGGEPGSEPADPSDPSDPTDPSDTADVTTEPGDPSDSGTEPASDPSDGLANTGSTTAGLIPLGVFLFIAGAGAVAYVAMRRRSAEA